MDIKYLKEKYGNMFNIVDYDNLTRLKKIKIYFTKGYYYRKNKRYSNIFIK